MDACKPLPRALHVGYVQVADAPTPAARYDIRAAADQVAVPRVELRVHRADPNVDGVARRAGLHRGPGAYTRPLFGST